MGIVQGMHMLKASSNDFQHGECCMLLSWQAYCLDCGFFSPVSFYW